MSALNAVSAEQLNEMIGDSERCRCVHSVDVKFLWFRISRKEERCTRRASAMILVTCSAHGSRKHAICRFHAWLLRHAKGYRLTCGECDQPAVWKDY